MSFNISRFKDIEKREYEIEVITPMFLGGADPKKAELRVPPFKSMLRFWWRALHPNLVQNDNFTSLYREESRIFGDSGDFGKSKIKLSIDISKEPSIIRYNPLPHKNSNFFVEGIAPLFCFNLILRAPKQIHKLFEFVSIAGGLGKRSRRGFGSFKIKKVDENNIDIKHINDIILSINESLNIQLNNKNNSLSVNGNFTNSYPYVKKIMFGQHNYSYDYLLKVIGNASHNNNSDFTGYARGTNRLASPVYVSIVKDKEYRIIITELNLSTRQRMDNNTNRQSGFIKDLGFKEVINEQ